MRSTRTVEFSTGLFVLLGFAALFFLVTQITNRELATNGKSYGVVAMFENIGSLKPGADEQYLKQGDRIEFVQDAFVLENLINQLASTFLRRDQGAAEGGNQGGTQEKAPAEEP